MDKKTFQETISLSNEVMPPALTPLARVLSPGVEVFPENQALEFDGHPRLVPLITNQRVNRVLSRFPVNIPTRFAPSFPKGEKVFEPSTKMKERLTSLQRNLARVYAPAEKEQVFGEIQIPTPPPVFPQEEIKQLREQLVQKEKELAEEKSREKRFAEMIETYQAQIASLTQKTQNLTAEIKKTEEELLGLREQTKSLRERLAEGKPSYQERESKVSELRTSLANSGEVIASLQEKIAEKEKLLQKTLLESQVEREQAKKTILEKQAAEALVKNLRAALQNAREELEKAREEGIDPAVVQSKEEEIQKLSARLQQKEQEAQQTKEAAEKLSGQFAEEEKLKTEIEQYKNQISNLQNQNQKLTGKLQSEEQELTKLRTSVAGLAAENKQKAERLAEQEKHLLQLRTQKEKLASFADELSQKLSKIQSEKHLETIVEAELGKEKPKKPVVKVVPPTSEEVLIKPLTTLPNAINGIVMTADGNLIENAVVIIKDKVGNSLRALRTNELGQFLVATPLPNGIYHLEVERKGEKFDILEVELTGEVLVPIEIKAK